MILAIFGILAIGGLLYPFAGIAIACGWLFGWVGVGLLRLVRHYTHDEIGKMLDPNNQSFSKLRYGLLVGLTLLVIAIPFFIAFRYQDVINPFAVFIAYFLERLLNMAQAKRHSKVEEG